MVFGAVGVGLGIPGLIIGVKNVKFNKPKGIPTIILGGLAVLYGAIMFLSSCSCGLVWGFGCMDYLNYW